MQIVNLDEQTSSMKVIINTVTDKLNGLMGLKRHQRGFRFLDPQNPTQAELDIKQGQADLWLADLDMSDIQTAVDAAIAIWVNPNEILHPEE